MSNISIPRTKIDCFTMDALEQIKAVVNDQTPSFINRGGVGKDVRELSDFALQQIKDAVGNNGGGQSGDVDVASVQSIWVLRNLTDSSDEVLYPNFEDESYTKVWEASVPPSPDPNPKSTKASFVTNIDLLDGIDIHANYTINADIVLCSDKNEPTFENVLTDFFIDNTNRIKEGFPLFKEERTPIFIRNLSQIDFGITSVVENVPKYAVLLKGVQTQNIQIEFPLKVDAVAENYDIAVYYYDGTKYTQVMPTPEGLYAAYDANLEDTVSKMIVVLDGSDHTDSENWICRLETDGFISDSNLTSFRIMQYSQHSNNGNTYLLSGFYGSDNTPFTLEMTNASNSEV